MKNFAVLTEDGAFALFFRPRPGDLTAQETPPREFTIQWKKNGNAWGSTRMGGGGGGGGGWEPLELTDA